MTSTISRRAAKNNCILAAFAAVAATAGLVPAHAKSKKPTGVWAWTKGSQTYIRARPSVNTPPVAKVAKHTRLFVWGKFDGWYRVETSDNKFGWIHNAYLNPSDKEKIAELSHRRARIASNRTENQTMYGSTEQLRAHYARYGAKGALVGLQKKGVRVSQARIAKARASTRVAKAPRPAAKSSTKTAPRLISTNRAPKSSILAPRLATAPGTRAAMTRPGADSNFSSRDEHRLTRTPDGTISSQPRRSDNAPNNAATSDAAVASSAAAKNDSDNGAETRRDQERRAAIRREEARLASLRAETARLEKQRLQEQKLAQARRDANARRAADARLAQAQQEAAARAANAQAQRLADSKRAAEAEAKRRANAEAAAQARRIAAQKREAARRAASERRRAARLARAKARQQRAQLLAARKAAEREELRRRMSMNPPSPQAEEAGLRPLSPDELLRAREQYLSSRSKSRPSTPQVVTPQQPSASTRDDLFERTPPGGAFNRQPMSQQPSQNSDLFQQMNYSSRGAGGFVLVSQKTASPKSAVRPGDARFSRGGSPRDYLLNRRRNMGQGMATQALSYRGMPYRRGAASARRGFDCSGLVYFLLRQRGYNPPRTSSGLASYGKPVARRDLQSGDIVLFANTYRRGVSHVGIYIGNNNFVHAANSGSGVKTDSLSSGYYARKYYGARRVQ